MIMEPLLKEVKSGLMQNIQGELLPQFALLLPKLDSILSGLQTLVNDPALSASVKRIDHITANLERSSVQLSQMMKDDVPAILDNVQGITAQVNPVLGNFEFVTSPIYYDFGSENFR